MDDSKEAVRLRDRGGGFQGYKNRFQKRTSKDDNPNPEQGEDIEMIPPGPLGPSTGSPREKCFNRWLFLQQLRLDDLWQRRVLSQEICVECPKLVVDPTSSMDVDPLLSTLTRRVDNGRQMCCARDAGQMSAMMESIVKKKAQMQVIRPLEMDAHLRRTPVSAHKQLLPVNHLDSDLTEPQFNTRERVDARFRTDSNEPLTEHARGLRVLDTSIEVGHTGLYFVYLSVLVRVRSEMSVRSFLEHRWVHYVYRMSSNNDPRQSNLLLTVAHTTSDDVIQDQESRFAGGAFYLNKGDLLKVTVFALGLIDYQKESSYLGLFMLESGRKENVIIFGGR